MLQAYANNVAVTTGQVISFPLVEFVGGTVTGTPGSTSIMLNAPGVYLIIFNATGTVTDAGTFGFQMQRAGNNPPQAQGSTTVAAGGTASVSFSTLMSVNACCESQGGISITFTYTGGAGTITLANAIAMRVVRS